jgi:hypothetical protein
VTVERAVETFVETLFDFVVLSFVFEVKEGVGEGLDFTSTTACSVDGNDTTGVGMVVDDIGGFTGSSIVLMASATLFLVCSLIASTYAAFATSRNRLASSNISFKAAGFKICFLIVATSAGDQYQGGLERIRSMFCWTPSLRTPL